MANPPMSLATVLDDEMKEVLALLEKTPSRRSKGSSSGASRRTSSPATQLPQSPRRSLLDVDDDGATRKTSLTGTNGVGVAIPPRQGSVQSVRSMLDIEPSPHSSPTPARSMLDVDTNTRSQSVAHSKSEASSPIEQKDRLSVHGQVHRSLSDTSTTTPAYGPRSVSSLAMLEPVYRLPDYRLSGAGYIPAGPTSPMRTSIGGRKTSAMAEVLRGGSISLLGPPPQDRDRGRHSIATTGISTVKSKSPRHRLSLRSDSPHSTNSSHFVFKDGKVIDMNKANRRRSDATAGGRSVNGDKKQRRRTDSGSKGAQLDSNYASVYGEDAIEDTSEEESISDDEKPRGRRQVYRGTDLRRAPVSKPKAKVTISKSPPHQTAAAEKENAEAAVKLHEKIRIRSLLDPEIKITAAGGDRSSRLHKDKVHPHTSFDEATSGFNTPVDSDAEQDITDIKRAQKLSINMTPVISTPLVSRCVRTIFRGDFSQMQQESRDSQRRIRKYLVATDLSDEAAHAMEWTIGTVLRDGDTLLAIYCIDEETGISNADGSGDEYRIKEQVAAVEASTKASASTPLLGPVVLPSPLGPGFGLNGHSASASPIGRERGKAEQERFRAVQDITERVSRLLRKTKLQVKVVIEVIHCKSPKHLITEVIDYISPTMVILGSRGQSQLKGVILGSFSNYLVTKSSVPVMVARKRLRKHTKYKRPAVRLANNLANPAVKSTLATAKID